MSDRSYFSLRYSIPGYTFLLFIFLFNLFPFYAFIIESGVEATFSAFIGILSLFGGSAIGFLISQVWWYFFQNGGAVFSDFRNKKIARDPIQKTIKKYNLIEPNRTSENYSQQRKRVVNVYGYIKHSEKERGMAELVNYTTRRWDMYHTLSSTQISLLLGSYAGYGIRLILVLLPTRIRFNGIYEVAFLIVLSIIAFFLVFIIQRGLEWINSQYDDMSSAIIINSTLSENHLRKVFSPEKDYFRKKFNSSKFEDIEIASDIERVRILLNNKYTPIKDINNEGITFFKKNSTKGNNSEKE